VICKRCGTAAGYKLVKAVLKKDGLHVVMLRCAKHRPRESKLDKMLKRKKR